jgi:hypothetical protein
MEDEKEFEALILRLFNNELTREEEATLFEQINSDIEKRRYFEDFESIWRLATIKQACELDLVSELSALRKKIENNSARVIRIGLPEINEPNIYLKKRFRLAPFFRGFTAAASVLLIFTVFGIFYNIETKEKSNTPIPHKAASINVVHREVNQSAKARLIELNDGSRILLYEKSEVTYLDNFDSLRNIALTGKARFIVSKDKKRPFTVIGGGIRTTVLGTQFTVTAYRNSKKTLVQLHEGKVVVHIPDNLKKHKKNYFLRAGDELLFNKHTFEVNVINKSLNKSIKKRAEIKYVNKDIPHLPQNSSTPWYMFNNQSLGEVFDQLSSIYNVKVSYKRLDVQNRKFIGKFNQTDSLESILKQIGTVNDLRVKKNKNGFVLYKE